MAVTHSTAARNAMANAVDDQVNSGSSDAQGDLVLLATSTVLVRIPLQNPAYGNASNGTIALAGVPLNAAATNSGTVNKYEIQNRDNQVVHTGSVTATGGGGDMTIDNTSITSGQTVEVTSHSYSAPS